MLVIQIIHGTIMATPHDGRYLASYDLDARDGRGDITSTEDPAAAIRFPNFQAALRTYWAISARYPRRPDGKPNMPLTAYSVEFVPLPRR